MIGLGVGVGLSRLAGTISAAWSPAALFASGEQGCWYDPSDFSTMFQDSFGKIPVTAVGQPVGLILDKSQGLALGPELLVNGNFNTGNTTGWTNGPNISSAVVGGAVQVTRNGVITPFNCFQQTLTVVVGKTYKIEFDVITSNGAAIGFYNSTNTNLGSAADQFIVGHNTNYVVATDTTLKISIWTDSGTTSSFDNFSVKEIAGNHALQATASSRPILRTDGTHFYLQFDGVDDWLQTAAIDFTVTDRMSVFSGTMFTVAGAYPTIFEQGGALYIDEGVVALFSDFGAADKSTVSVGSGGDALKCIFNTANSNLTKYVISAFLNYSQTSNAGYTLRRNQVTTPLTYSGATPAPGMFNNYAMYIGARSNGAVDRFNSNLYSLIVRGAESTAGEITNTETWVNGKTGAY